VYPHISEVRPMLGRLGFLLAAVFVFAGACSSNTQSSDSSCVVGSEACPCAPDGTCDGGLVCLSKVCVRENAAGGGNAGSSGGGAMTSGGTPGGGAGAGPALSSLVYQKNGQNCGVMCRRSDGGLDTRCQPTMTWDQFVALLKCATPQPEPA